ncbi:MAG: hypothetical protein OEM91_03190 [Hyphomicrobiales bacterium]|nr:hypothetical protein [Hyphomicrobiales bacterium]
MRTLFASIFVLVFLLAPEPSAAQFASLEGKNPPNNQQLLEWMYKYRSKPKPNRVPDAVRAMKKLGFLRDSEKSEFFVGFIAGVLGANQPKARSLVRRMFPMPAKEQAVIIKAIAYSGLPDWQALLTEFAPRMPHRKPLIEQYLSGEKKPLMEQPLEEGTSTLYALWGYYVATGYYDPVVRVIAALQWSKGGTPTESAFRRRIRAAFNWSEADNDLNKATIGGTAKWTLVSHAERDRHLIDFYRVQYDYQTPEVAAKLNEVIAAADAFESERIRKEELAAIEEIKRRNPEGAGFNRATTLGSVAIATGCVAATASGAAVIAVPCIITGAVYTGVVKMLRGSP